MLAEGFERPSMPCYISAHIPGPRKDLITDAFGKDVATLEEGRREVKDFFKRYGFSFQE